MYYIEPKCLLKAKNWIKHAQNPWGEIWGLSFAATHSVCTSIKSKYILTILFIIFPNHLFMEAKNKGVHPSCLWWLILHPRWTRAWTRFVCPFELAKDNGDSPSAFNKSKSFYKILNFIKVLLITTSRYNMFL